AAMLAGVGIGLFKNLTAASAMRGKIDAFRAGLAAETRQTRLDGWATAVKSVIDAAH
ncbi:MAG: glycerol kinase, partial [Sphingomonas sp.]|nr:glycerol kinase [Sphingomonas sp.]